MQEFDQPTIDRIRARAQDDMLREAKDIVRMCETLHIFRELAIARGRADPGLYHTVKEAYDRAGLAHSMELSFYPEGGERCSACDGSGRVDPTVAHNTNAQERRSDQDKESQILGAAQRE